MPKTASSNKNKPNIPDVTMVKVIKPNKLPVKMSILKTKPILAANIFGPALMFLPFNSKQFTIVLDEAPIGLYFENSDARRKKSNIMTKIGTILPVNQNRANKSNTKAAFVLATRSFILLSDIGHNMKFLIINLKILI
jgi:hypothetical protein